MPESSNSPEAGDTSLPICEMCLKSMPDSTASFPCTHDLCLDCAASGKPCARGYSQPKKVPDISLDNVTEQTGGSDSWDHVGQLPPRLKRIAKNCTMSPKSERQWPWS
ncbi:hypothetical protein FA15DRAFT_659483 [Coprinopsis marcescibilis]|uniref:RING-type domain-containing protein n=1 Tax=Coprinopsis marcescibilis TaxID=230819 RepID=A0A5C3KI90_COPMA|nr:hypothetical protein FA15DRAFT_659483 [Coprinopsis marcescibilis]